MKTKTRPLGLSLLMGVHAVIALALFVVIARLWDSVQPAWTIRSVSHVSVVVLIVSLALAAALQMGVVVLLWRGETWGWWFAVITPLLLTFLGIYFLIFLKFENLAPWLGADLRTYGAWRGTVYGLLGMTTALGLLWTVYYFTSAAGDYFDIEPENRFSALFESSAPALVLAALIVLFVSPAAQETASAVSRIEAQRAAQLETQAAVESVIDYAPAPTVSNVRSVSSP